MSLEGMSFCLSGKMKGYTRKEFKALIEDNGGEVKGCFSKAVSHLISTPDEVSKETGKIKKAKNYGTMIVSQDFVEKCIEKDEAVEEQEYLLYDHSSGKATKKTGAKRCGDRDDDEDEPATKKRKVSSKKKKKKKKKKSGRC